MFKATLFACVIAAAGFGCKNDRNARETSYSSPVESSTYNTGSEVTGRDMQSADTIRTDESGHTVHETQPAPQARPGDVNTRAQGANTDYGSRTSGAGGSMREGTEIDDDSDTASIPQAGGTDQIQSGNGTIQSGQAGQGAGANASPNGTATGTGGDTTTTEPTTPSGTSETATGTGTTTNTGINTENAGQGGTDDPQR